MTETETLLLDAFEKLSKQMRAQNEAFSRRLDELAARLDELCSDEDHEFDDAGLPSLKQLDEWTTSLDASLAALSARVADLEAKI